jgi:flagellar hook-associated protein 2
MAGIQVGGIVSGMDTNALVDQLIAQAQIPVDKLYGEYSYKQLEEEVYDDINNMLGDVTSDLLTLRLESTFKSKNVSSTNESVATATATTDAAVGTHTVKVNQLAENSSARSSYTRVANVSTGAGLIQATGRPVDYLEGVHTTTVAASGAGYLATTDFVLNDMGRIQKQVGDTIDSAYVDADGTLLQDMSGLLAVTFTDEFGNTQAVGADATWGATGDDINEMAAFIELKLNDEMNEAMGTNAVQYFAMRAEYDEDTTSWSLAMYETTPTDYQISMTTNDAAMLSDELGFAEAFTPLTSSVNAITKYIYANDLTEMADKLFESDAAGSVIPGATFSHTATLTEGTFVIAQDASLKVASETPSYYTSTQVSGGVGLDTAVDGLENAGFSSTVDDGANGYFTINDVKITIDDYSSLSVSDLLGKINGSGAGVVATYDSATDTFKIASNEPGSSTISLGAWSDTSDILSKMGLAQEGGRTFTAGTTEGSIDPTVDLQNSGLSSYPYSGTFTINGVSIYVDAGEDTLYDVIEKVNSSGAGVTMSYDESSDKVTLRSDGIDAITVGSPNDTSNLLVALNLTNSDTTTKTIGTEGQRAIVEVDGHTYVRDTNEVDDIINGVTLTLNSVDSAPTTINVQIDTEKAVDAFATFVSHYNKLMEMLAVPEYDEDDKEYMEYLTDTDKESMSDSEIEDYMEKYELYNKYDIIRRSSELRNMDNTLREIFFGIRPNVTGSINDISDIGIEIAGAGDLDTENYGYIIELTTDKDELIELLNDNDDFMDALMNNSDSVFEFFGKNSDIELDEDNDGEIDAGKSQQQYDDDLGWSRYFTQMIRDRYTNFDGMIGGKLGNTGTIYTELTRLEKRITTQEDRVDKQLERYWAQFTAMEKAIADAQAASADFTNASG